MSFVNSDGFGGPLIGPLHVRHPELQVCGIQLVSRKQQCYRMPMIEDVRQHFQAGPFEPFTIVTSSGRRYSVPTADHAGLNPKGSRIVVWFDDDSGVTISSFHIVSIEKGLPSANGGKIGEQGE